MCTYCNIDIDAFRHKPVLSLIRKGTLQREIVPKMYKRYQYKRTQYTIVYFKEDAVAEMFDSLGKEIHAFS